MANPPQDLMRYDLMAQDALRGVVKAALKRAASQEGLPGDHHFYITFKTHAPGVSGPPDVLSKWPDEMTIVLQHRFWDLAPGETFFSVTLEFGGQPKRLSIPYAAVSQFVDPSVQFRLPFEVTAGPSLLDDGETREEEPEAEAEAETAPAPAAAVSAEPKVVSLDQFRKK